MYGIKSRMMYIDNPLQDLLGYHHNAVYDVGVTMSEPDADPDVREGHVTLFSFDETNSLDGIKGVTQHIMLGG